MNGVLKYGWYLLCWVGLWVLITVTTQLPECYQRSMSLDAGTPVAINRDLAEFAMWRAFYEVPFGLFWGSLSWWLYSCRFDVQRHLIPPRLLQQRNNPSSPITRLTDSTIILVALVQGVVFGFPLAYLYTLFANFGMGNDDVPSVTVNDQSITVEAMGIVLAFVLPTLSASSIASRSA